MIVFKKFGKTIKIRNDDWKKLKERFDAKEAKWESLDKKYFLVTEDCPLCSRYGCSACPFYAFDKMGDGDEVGCVEFLKKLFKPLYFDSGIEEIIWSRHANKLARKQLGQILKMMDKIEASQGRKNATK